MKRIAIVLRGPMGVGKSTVTDELCKAFNAGPTILLDRYHAERGSMRETIFTSRKEHALVIELGCAEPNDLSFEGFTRGACSWHDLLRREGREVHLYKLWAEWQTIRQNMSPSRSSHLLGASLWHRAYSTGLDVVSLPPSLAELETKIDVTGKSAREVADEIRASVQVA